jgi:hypothetical protein
VWLPHFIQCRNHSLLLNLGQVLCVLNVHAAKQRAEVE